MIDLGILIRDLAILCVVVALPWVVRAEIKRLRRRTTRRSRRHGQGWWWRLPVVGALVGGFFVALMPIGWALAQVSGAIGRLR